MESVYECLDCMYSLNNSYSSIHRLVVITVISGTYIKLCGIQYALFIRNADITICCLLRYYPAIITVAWIYNGSNELDILILSSYPKSIVKLESTGMFLMSSKLFFSFVFQVSLHY